MTEAVEEARRLAALRRKEPGEFHSIGFRRPCLLWIRSKVRLRALFRLTHFINMSCEKSRAPRCELQSIASRLQPSRPLDTR